MRTKLWLIIALCLLLAACQTLLGRLRDNTPATLTITETARLSATSWVVGIDTITATAPSTLTPTKTSSATTSPLPTETTTSAETETSTPISPTPPTRPDPSNPDVIPKILFFEVNTKEVDPGDTVVLSWKTSGATGTTLYLMPPSHQFPQSGWDVAPTGNYTVTIHPDSRNYSEFMLYAFNTTEHSTSQGVTVYLRCPDPWFFAPEPDICPTTPLLSVAAEQYFEQGVMLWIAEQDRIVVLYDDDYFSPQYTVFQDEWDEGQPESDPTMQPPAGLDQPIRGFGLVWRSYSEVQKRLGWATGAETGFDTIVQQTTRYKYNATYIRALDGNVWYLGPEGSTWEKLEVQR